MSKAFVVERRPLPGIQELRLAISFPPSVNAMYFNVPGKGRVKAQAYHDWIELAGWELKTQKRGHVNGQVHITIMLDDNRNGDCDNRIKPILDLLVYHRIIDGDSKATVRKVSAEWSRVNGAVVLIERAPLASAARVAA